MPEQLPQFDGTSENLGLIEPSGDKETKPVELGESLNLDQIVVEVVREQESSGERGEIGSEVLDRSQAYLNFLFGKGRFNLEEAYRKGEILSSNLLRAELARKEGYTLEVVLPGGPSRDEVIAAINKKYPTIKYRDSQGKVNLGQEIYLTDLAQQDLPNTPATLSNPSPNQLYVALFRPQANIAEAHPETLNQTPAQLQDTLARAQKKDLSLRGLTLSQYLLLDAYQYQQTNHHLDEQGWEYLLEETVPNTSHALLAGRDSADHRVFVSSHSNAGSNRGARLAAVPPESPFSFLFSAKESHIALDRIKKVFGQDIRDACKTQGGWQRIYYNLSKPRGEDGKSVLDLIEESKSGAKYINDIFSKYTLARPAGVPEAETLLRSASDANGTSPDPDTLLRPSANTEKDEPIN